MKLIAPSVEIRHWLEVPAKPLKMEGTLGEVEVKPPYSDIGHKPVRLLLISHKWRDGQVLHVNICIIMTSGVFV